MGIWVDLAAKHHDSAVCLEMGYAAK
jgi:hypothetical protein